METRELTRFEDLPDQGLACVPDGFEDFTYEVLLDEDALRAMAMKAAANKTGKSADGPLKVQVISRRRRG